MSREDRFWHVFLEWQGRLRRKPQSLEVKAALISALGEYHRGLVIDWERNESEGHTLIISAQGVVALFPAVVRLVDAAPLRHMPNWQVVALRPPRQGHFAMHFPEFSLATDQVMYRAKEKVPGKWAIELRIFEWEANGLQTDTYLRLFMENLVGEYTASTRVATITAQPWLGETLDDSWLPIVRLPAFMAKIFGLPN